LINRVPYTVAQAIRETHEAACSLELEPEPGKDPLGATIVAAVAFWNYTTDQDAVAALVRSAPADVDAETIARLLVQFALDSGGMDNVTVAVARLTLVSNGAQ
jgi:hypothetical protein